MNKSKRLNDEGAKEDEENANLSFKDRYIPRFGKAFQGASIAARGGLQAIKNPELKSNYKSFVLEMFTFALVLYAFVGVISFFLAPVFAIFGFAPMFQLLTMVPLWAMSITRKRNPISSNRLFLSELKTIDAELGKNLEALSQQGESKGWASDMKGHLLKSFHFFKYSILFSLMGIVPIVGPILSTFSQILFNASKLGWNLMTIYTVSCKKMTYKQHKRWIRARRWTLLGFGLVYSSLVSIPFVGPLVLGIAQASAAHLQEFGFYNAEIPLKKRERREKERREAAQQSSEGLAEPSSEPVSSSAAPVKTLPFKPARAPMMRKDAPTFIPMVKEPSYMKNKSASSSGKFEKKDRFYPAPVQTNDLLEPKKSN